MSEIRRFYVEKRQGLATEAKELLRDITESLAIDGLADLRILYRYDIEGASEKDLANAKQTVLSEPPVENLYEEEFPLASDEVYFVKEYLPGQFDQCADSLAQCFQIISGELNVSAAAATVYVLRGDLSGAQIKEIENYCHNPVDSRIGQKEKPQTLKMALAQPADIAVMAGFIDKTDDELAQLRTAQGYAMSTKDLIHCREYFKNEEKRNPTVTEIKVIDTYWSDHCRHTTFLTELKDIHIEEGYYQAPIQAAFDEYMAERSALYGQKERPITLMDMAVVGMKALRAKGLLENLDQSEEINACSIEITVDVDGEQQPWLLMFKNETHNHPTEIEPYGGAATCLGGAIRDPLSGRSYVYQAMRITGAGDPRTPVADTLAGKLPQRKITREAAHGFSAYGNQIGLATGHVREIYDDGFVAKRMEIGAVMGAAPKENVVRERPAPGDVVVVVGGRTGRDGCGGATGSSKEHSADSINECGAEVQKGNPPTERKLQRLFRSKDAATLIKRCNDFGAGGVCVAIGELAASLSIDLDKVQKKYEGLDGTELAISESQERMAVVVTKENAQRFIALAAQENLEAVIVAEITDDGYMRMLWRGKEIVSLKRSFLDTNGAAQEAQAAIAVPEKFDLGQDASAYDGGFASSLKQILGDLNVCSQKGLVERFDATIGAATVLMPFGGKHQLTPEDVMAAKLPVPGETTTASLMSAAYDPALSKRSPFHGGLYAVVESTARLVAAGCDYSHIRLTFQEYFEKMTADPHTWGKPAAALLGALRAQLALGIAAIGGKDSMSGTFGDMNVPPVLTSFAVGVEPAAGVHSAAMAGDGFLYALLPKYDAYDLIDFEDIKKKYEWFYREKEHLGVTAAAAVKRFGMAETLVKMAFGNGVGIAFEPAFLDAEGMAALFRPYYGGIVFETKQPLAAEDTDAVVLLGKTNASGIIKVGAEETPLAEFIAAWEAPLEKIFPTKTDEASPALPEIPLYDIAQKGIVLPTAKGTVAKPKVVITVFPGTNCEDDTKKAFLKAGAEVETVIFRNLTSADIEQSIAQMAKAMAQAQIIMIPGGFSAGDEPNGSAKFIATVFRNPQLSEAVQTHLTQRDGLMLGICNGFQALVKLGLLPFGKIAPMNEDSPTIYYNKIGRHISQLVQTKVISNRSPFMAGCRPGDIFGTPESHGEGRFLLPEPLFRELLAQGQIASVYVDDAGQPTMARPYNPNGSMYAVEGIFSPDGRVFGRMGHSERIGENVYKNVPAQYDTKIFESAVRYFTGK